MKKDKHKLSTGGFKCEKPLSCIDQLYYDEWTDGYGGSELSLMYSANVAMSANKFIANHLLTRYVVSVTKKHLLPQV